MVRNIYHTHVLTLNYFTDSKHLYLCTYSNLLLMKAALFLTNENITQHTTIQTAFFIDLDTFSRYMTHCFVKIKQYMCFDDNVTCI